jgi:MFS family permease
VLIFIFAALGSFGRGAGAGAGTVGPYQPAEQALLADAVSARHRNSLFGRIAFASSLGALIGSGPLTVLPGVLGRFGLPVAHGLAPYRFSFVVLAALAVLAGLLAIPVREARPARDPVPAAPVSGRRWRRPHLRLSAKTRPILYRLWATNTVNGLAVGFFGPFITYWFFRRYGAGADVVGPLFAVINLAAMVSNLMAARFAAWLGVVRAITVSRALQAVLIVPMVLAPTFWLAGAFYLLRMLAQRMGLPLRQSYVMGVVAPEERGSVAALSNLPSQAASAVSPTAAGYLFDHVALALPFEIGALLQAVNTVMFFVFFRAVRPPEESERRRDVR